MNPKLLLFVPSLVFANPSSATFITFSANGVIDTYFSEPFFDSSVEQGVTPFSAHTLFDTNSMALRELVDDSGADYIFWNYGFNVDGLFESTFGNYVFSSAVSNLAVQVAHYTWSSPNVYDVNVIIETFVNPDNPVTAERFWSTTPFTRDGVDFKELWEEAPEVYFGGSIGFRNSLLLADPGVIDESWLRDELWSAFLTIPDSGSHFMYAGSYSEESAAFGLVGGIVGPWNGGTIEYRASEVLVPDVGYTFSMLGIGLFGLLVFRRYGRSANGCTATPSGE